MRNLRRAARGSGRLARHPITVVLVLVAVVGGYFAIPLIASAATGPTYDVSKAGVFELDGNTAQDKTPPPPYDWESLFTSTGALKSPAPANLIAGEFSVDPTATSSDFAFTGGGSKDINDTSSWQCATNPQPNNKDELSFTGAALFSAPMTSPAAGHQLFYVNLSRGVSTSGSSNAGFWLFKKPTSCNPATGLFTPPHSDGDLFLFASYTQGGTQVTINTYHWSTASNSLVGPDGTFGACDAAGGPGAVCGISNSGAPAADGSGTLPGAFTSPWGPVLQNGFFEAGVDLTALFNPNGGTTNKVPCFASFEADTRSSGSSVSAQLKDFAGGSFNTCVATTSTLPASSATGSIVLGGNNTDTATVTPSQASTVAPAGTVKFYECGPLAAPPSANGPNCSATTGTLLTNTAHPDGAIPLSTTSPYTATSPTFTPTQVGTYCFSALYSGDTNYGPSADPSPSTECFTVTPAPTMTKTTPSNVGPFVLGGSVTDSGVITANPALTALNPPPAIGGSLTYYVCGPLATTSTSGPNCDSVSGTKLSTVTVTNGVAPASSSFTPTQVGTYCFLGVYSGNANYQGSSDSSFGECFTVGPSPTQTMTSPSASLTAPITLGASVTDSATVAPNPALAMPPFPAVDGAVFYYVCGPLSATTASGNCSIATSISSLGSATVGAGGVAGPSSPFIPTTAGTYCFLGVFVPGNSGNYLASSDSGSNECFQANPAPAVLSSTVSLDDTVRVVKNGTAGAPNGDVTFTLYGPFTSAPAGCTANNAVAGSAKTVTAGSEVFDASGNGYWTVNEDIPAVGSGTVWYAWGASFTAQNAGGNKNYADGSLGCTAEQVQLTYGTGSGFAPPMAALPS